MKNKKLRKKLKVITSVALLSSGIATPAVVAAVPNSFKDVPSSSAAYNSIMYLTNKGVISGFSDGTFKPQEQLTRGQAAKILALSLELNLSNVQNPRFKDVPTSHPFYKYIAALKNAGIIDGFSDGRFGVNDPLNRGQMVKILGNAYGLEKKPLKNYSFTDVSPSAFYAEYLQSLIDLGITNGVSKTKFAPNAVINRGQMAMFVHRSELATNNRTDTISATISSFDGNRLVTNKGTFDIPNSLRSFFSRQNETVLKNAQLTFSKNRDDITKLIDLEITNPGTTYYPLTLEGNNLTLSGNLFINADHVIVNDLNVEKNVTLGNSIQNSFKGQDLNVNGTLFVNQGNYSVTNTNTFSTDVSFTNSNIKTIQSSKNNASLSFSNRTTVESLTLNTNTIVRTVDTSQITNLSLAGALTEATIHASVRNISINTTKSATLTGNVSPNTVSISNTQPITLNNNGTISTLTVPRNGIVSLGNSTWVTNVSIPSNVSIYTLIRDFDIVKHRIERINGIRSSDYKPPSTTTPTNPTISLYSANFNTNGNVTMFFDQAPEKFTYTNSKPYYEGAAITYRRVEIPNLTIANGTYLSGQGGTLRWTENGRSYTASRTVVSSSGSLKTITFYEGTNTNNVIDSFTYTLSSANKSLIFDTNYGADTVNVVKNSTYTVAGSSGIYITINGSSLLNSGVTVMDEASLRNAIDLKLTNIIVDRNITLTKPLEIDYPNFRIYSTNNSKITVSNQLKYKETEGVITFTKNATNAKWQRLHLEGHKDTVGHGILSYATNTVIEDSEISKFGGFNIASYLTPTITLTRVKLTDSLKGGLLVNTKDGSNTTTVNLTNIETRANAWGGIEFFADKNKKITVTGTGNIHDDQNKTEQNSTPGIWTEGEGTVTFSLRDFIRYTKVSIKETDKNPPQVWYYQIDQAAELIDAVESLNLSADNQPTFYILGDLTLLQPLEINHPVKLVGNGKTITLNSDGDGSNTTQGLLISSKVSIDNLNFTAGTKLTDNLIEVLGDGASLSLSNSTLRNAKMAAIYVGDSNDENKAEELILSDRITFDRNILGGVGAKNNATINAMKASITINNSTTADYRVYEENLKSPVTIRPVFWDDTLDVNFQLPANQYTEYRIYKDEKGNRIKTDSKVEQIIYSKK